jgi:hypothetical protein
MGTDRRKGVRHIADRLFDLRVDLGRRPSGGFKTGDMGGHSVLGVSNDYGVKL